jgi:two-component sensor histidine kinase
MQVISSLIGLQASYVEDRHAHLMFQESQNRIRSMALVHERLYQSQDIARIDFADYVHDLTSQLLRSYEAQSVSLEIQAENINLNIDAAIPCGLIINELVSNALKHAFPHGEGGLIHITLRTEYSGQHTIIVRDDGVGIPNDLDVLHTDTLGLQLVTSLVGQLDGTIGLRRGHGTTFEIRFAAS